MTLGYCKKIGDKKYKVKYDVPPENGKVRQLKTETLSNLTRSQAEAILAKRKEAVARGECVLEGQMTFDDLFSRFMGQKRASNKSPTTIERYESLFRTYLRLKFGRMRIGELKTHHLISAYADWHGKRGDGRAGHLSPTTVKHIHDLMRNVLNRAVKWGLIPRNVALAVDSDDMPKVSKHESNVLDELQLRRLLDEAKSPSPRSRKRGYLSSYSAFYPAVAFLAFTGARRGECLAVKWAGVDLDAGTVTIRESLGETRAMGVFFKVPKNGKSRTICLPGNLVQILRAHRAKQATEQLVLGGQYLDYDLAFAKPDGSPIKPWNFAASFANLVKRAGVPRIRLHDLRDTHASLLAKAGVAIEVVSKRLGHSGIAITYDRYLTVYLDRDAAAASAIERLVG